ncbi:hypothetical protein AAF712_001802 [Marasmius tenuissimus]|uniref:NmrA-like domain-containing protein n=1 Tax=Marasmius tenuissimus TaxID=585030 RepID=A0ABR3ACZ1_9AGAR
MSAYNSFCIVGVGGIGTPILNAFLSAEISPLVLTRKSSPKAFPPSVKVAKVDFQNVDEIADALREHKVDVVISTITHEAISVQYLLADAAKKTGVKLFVPSEFGTVTDGISGYPGESEASPLVLKDKFAAHLKSIGLPYTRLFVGSFFEYIPWITGLAENGKVNIAGKGESLASFTDEADVGGFLVHILTSRSPAELENKSLRIEGDSISLVDLAKRLQKDVQYVARVPGEPAQVKNYLASLFESGRGSVRWDYSLNTQRQGGDANDNKLWPGHQWKTLADFQLGAS